MSSEMMMDSSDDTQHSVITASNVKPKRKNSEKRKEKSRYAARARRSHESEQFSEMAKNLPVPQSLVSNMDKASLMRLSISYIKQKQILQSIIKDNGKELVNKSGCTPTTTTSMTETCLLQALDGFVLILSAEGEIVYISESVENYLGLKQLDLIGSSVYDYSHPCDHGDIKDILIQKSDKSSTSSTGASGPLKAKANGSHSTNGVVMAKVTDQKSGDSVNSVNNEVLPGGVCNKCSFLVRMKCTLTEKGKCINLKAATYKVVYCSGYHTKVGKMVHLILTAEPIWNPSSSSIATAAAAASSSPIDKPLGKYVFLSQHSPDMKIISIDKSIEMISGFKPSDLIGKSVFNFYHALDVVDLGNHLKTLFSKGQAKTGYYRFLAKGGGYFWLYSEATVVIANNHSSQPQSVICVNYVISGVENEDEIISVEQVRQPVEYQQQKQQQQQHIEKCDLAIDGVYKPLSLQQTQNVPERVAVAVAPPEPQPLQPQHCAPGPLPPPPSNYPYIGSYPVPTPVTSSLFSPLIVSGSPLPADIPVALPQPATASIFAPRTADMSSGFLMFTSDEENPTTVLTDDDLIDPEQDLTHLAPLAGDTCDIPLDICNLPPLDGLMDDLLKEMGLTSNGSSSPSSSLDSGGVMTGGADSNVFGASDGNSGRSPPPPPPTTSILPINETDTETNDNFPLDCFTADDNKLMSYIPPAVAEEEIQFSCDDESNESPDLCRTGAGGGGGDVPLADDAGGSVGVVNGVGGCPALLQKGQNINSNYFSRSETALDDGGTISGARCASESVVSGGLSDRSIDVNSLPGGGGNGGHSPLTNDPFLSFTNGGFFDGFTSNVGGGQVSSLNSSKSLLNGHTNINNCNNTISGLTGTSSSVWDSPPPSSNNSTLTNDLDMCGSLEEDGDGSRTSLSLGADFPLLNDDSMWDTFINSNIGDVINTEDFLPSRDATSSASSSRSSSCPPGKGPAPTLPLNSNLAMLLQEPSQPLNVTTTTTATANTTVRMITSQNNNQQQQITIDSGGGITTTAYSDGGIIPQASGVVIVHLKDKGKLNSGDVHKRVQNLLRSQAQQGKQIPTKLIATSGGFMDPKNARNIVYTTQDFLYGNRIIDDVDRGKTTTTIVATTHKRQCPASPISAKKQHSGNGLNSTNGTIASNVATANNKRLKTDAFNVSVSKPSPVMSASSVLMNLLVNGEDVNNGYTKSMSSGTRTSSAPSSSSSSSNLPFSRGFGVSSHQGLV